MSLAGLKKQFNKANQFMNEKIGGAKGTELDNEFCEMEKKIDVLAKLVDDIINKTHEFLQPNPASRARMLTLNTLSKIRGQVNVRMYPQPEGSLGDYMIKHGNDLGQDCLFGQSLVETGESYKHLAEIKYNLEDAVKQNFIDPLTQLQNKDLKEVNHYLKKMSGRRLDFDCKSRKREKGSGILDEEVRIAEKKFEESRDSAENAMQNLLNSEQEHIAQLIAFVSAQSDFHKQALDTLNSLLGTLETKRVEASSKSHSSHISKSVNCLKEIRAQPKQDDAYSTFDMSCVRKNGDGHPFARALYTFEPESEVNGWHQNHHIATTIIASVFIFLAIAMLTLF